MIARKIILAIGFILFVNAGWSKTVSTPEKVLIGAYPMMLQKFNYAENTFDINFYLWTVSTDPAYNPKQSLEITNAINYVIKNDSKGKNPDGSTYNTLHYYSTNHHQWDIANFPFDRQLLKVEVEDADEIESIKFIPDYLESHIHPQLEIPGWKIQKFYISVSENTYDSNLGNYADEKSTYSKFTFYLDIKREGSQLFINYFIGFIVSFILCIIILSMRPSRIYNRLNLSLGSIFSAVGNKYIIDNYLPPSNIFTLSDAVQLIGFSMILITIINTVVTSRISETRSPELALRINRYTQIIAIPFFFIIFLVFLLRALLS